MESTITLPCSVGDTVYLTTIDRLDNNGNPIHKAMAGTVFTIQIEKNDDKIEIWLRVAFGVLYCCRKYTDFFLTKEEVDKEVDRLNKIFIRVID